MMPTISMMLILGIVLGLCTGLSAFHIPAAASSLGRRQDFDNSKTSSYSPLTQNEGGCDLGRKRSSQEKIIPRMSGAGSTVAPPSPPKTTDRWGGGGEDGIRILSLEESEAALASFEAGAKRHRRIPSQYEEYMSMLQGMKAWREALSTKRIGCKRLILGNFKRGKLCCIGAAEVVWRGGLNRDVRICLRLIVVNPMYDLRVVGFETLDALKSFGMQNALLLDLSPLMSVPSLRVFCLASAQTLDKDPEQVFQDPLIQQYNSRIRRSSYVLDGIPSWADLGPYWYEGDLPRNIRFFFRKRFKAVNEFEVTFERPGAGVSTGSGTVGGARVIPMDVAEAMTDIPGHCKVRDIERQLSRRLLSEVQDEDSASPL